MPPPVSDNIAINFMEIKINFVVYLANTEVANKLCCHETSFGSKKSKCFLSGSL